VGIGVLIGDTVKLVTESFMSGPGVGDGEGVALTGIEDSPESPVPEKIHPAIVIDIAINAQNIADFNIFALIYDYFIN